MKLLLHVHVAVIYWHSVRKLRLIVMRHESTKMPEKIPESRLNPFGGSVEFFAAKSEKFLVLLKSSGYDEADMS